MTGTSIAAIICAHSQERWDLLVRSVGSLRIQSKAADEIIVSIDNNAELAQRCIGEFGDTVRVVQNTGQQGVSGTRNVAAESTECEILAFLDDDATAVPLWIESLSAHYEDLEVLGVGGQANPEWEGTSGGPRWFPASFYWVVGCSHSGIRATPHRIRNFIGCNMSVRRSAWEAVGGFSEHLGRVGYNTAGCDETDFCIRVEAEQSGFFLHEPLAIVKHHVPLSRQSIRYFVRRCFSEGVAKGQISSGSGAAVLDDERRHLTRTMPAEFGRGLLSTLTGDSFGIVRSLAIVLGTVATGLGFLRSMLQNSFSLRPQTSIIDGEAWPEFRPSRVDLVDLNEAVPVDFGDPNSSVFAVVRRGSQLVGVVPDATPMQIEPLRQTPQRFAPGSTDSEYRRLDQSVAVVIATRNRTESLGRCLDSLASSTVDPKQVIVVDNAPADDQTRLMIADRNRESGAYLTYLRCERAGLANAHNEALDFLESDIVAFTDDDVLIDPLWIDQIRRGFELAPGVMCVTGAIMPAELDTWPQQWAESASRFNKGFEPRVFDTSTNRPDDPLFPFTAGTMGSGANMAFDTNWLKRNGGFSQVLGAGTIALGGDDLRAFYDVVATGNRLAFNPDAIVFHHHHRSTSAIANQSYGYGAGLTAYLASVVHDDPRTLRQILPQLGRAVERARKIASSPQVTQYPGHRYRSRLHRRGLISGPLRYVRSLRQV